MVIICKDKFCEDNKYEEYFHTFPFTLSDFQKYAIKSIVEGNHILVTAHTGSGKTLPAEFSIEYFVSKGKKVIYTSPIKALSNQKFHEFSKKFPHISFGILTGDIKFNPEADVLIMTTEILRNTLLQKTNHNNENTNLLQFQMDFENELACVVFDEIHYINDLDRGKVWEETIMFMPNHIQLVMLSATIDKSDIFAKWIEDVKKDENHQKIVYLAPTNHRVVPLKHYFYTTMPQGPFKNIKDKEFIKFINQFLHKPIALKNETTNFDKENYEKIRKLLIYINRNNCFIKPAFVLNQITKYLNENNMLPAICFVFSRKLVEKYAQCINISLFEPESNIPSIIQKECEQILRKLPNFKEYINLPEFQMIIKLLEKGIAIHHSGIIPVFREMIELLFAKGYIKLLFATETFAVGINMPTKTVLFTGFEKFNGSNMRMLLSHEYTQMAGRAGRRGLDTIGYVIHLNNMFNLPLSNDYELLLNGKPQTLQSKFNISYNLVLNFIKENNNIIDFANKSMCNGEIQSNILSIENTIKILNNDLKDKHENPIYKNILSNFDKYNQYTKLSEDIKNCKQKIRKQIQRNIEEIENSSKQFKYELEIYKSIKDIENKIQENKEYIKDLKNRFNNDFNNIITFLQKNNFIDEENNIKEKGILAINIQETHCLAFIEFLEQYNYFENFSASELAAILSCFANIRIKEDYKIFDVKNLTNNNVFNTALMSIKNILEKYEDQEYYFNIYTNESPCYLFELVNPVLNWCNSNDEIECKKIIKQCEYDYEIFTGEFVKALLKINNMVNEMELIAEYTGNISFLHKLREIPELTLKFIATNQSLYI